MKSFKKTYLSLGSNIGNKSSYLQQAVSQIEQHVGLIAKVSRIYESPAWGFDSDEFLNMCVEVITTLNPEELLHKLLDIETQLGRERGANGYSARTIDLDILFYDQETIETENLIIPHIQLHNRKFVLKPLCDIAADYTHPKFTHTIDQLRVKCTDASIIRTTDKKVYFGNKNDFSNFNFVAIEGNIGAGKTTLAKKIAEDFTGKLILEQFADNPFLPQFYEDQQRYAFPLEMSFLAERYQQFTDDTTQPDLFKSFMVSDYDINKSLVFAKVTLQKEEFLLYRKIFGFMYRETTKPDLYVYLYQNSERLLENIKKRGRDYEQNIKSEYLEKINLGYLDFIKTNKQDNALIIDVSELDFVKNQSDYQFVIDEMHKFASKSKI